MNKIKNGDIFTFTNCSAVGMDGPSQAQINAAYSATNLSGKVTVKQYGTQEWTVPASGIYRIKASGAGATARQGGSGAEISGDFELIKGEVINIVVGQKPNPFTSSHGGGAGGTFVVRQPYNSNDSILVIAGGGGGGHNGGFQPNSHGRIETSGGPGTNGTAGGTNGQAGVGSNASSGAGFFSNGSGSGTPLAFVNGSRGGANSSNQGGFGGGGSQGNSHGAGGGGYSGGGATGSSPYHGGGGGSFNSGENQENKARISPEDGSVVITAIKLQSIMLRCKTEQGWKEGVSAFINIGNEWRSVVSIHNKKDDGTWTE